MNSVPPPATYHDNGNDDGTTTTTTTTTKIAQPTIVVVHGTGRLARGGPRQHLPLLPAPQGLLRLPTKHHRDSSSRSKQVGQSRPASQLPAVCRFSCMRARLRPAYDRKTNEHCNVSSKLVSAGSGTTVVTGKATTAIVPMDTAPAIPAIANRRMRRRMRPTKVVRRRRPEGTDRRSRFPTSKAISSTSSQIWRLLVSTRDNLALRRISQGRAAYVVLGDLLKVRNTRQFVSFAAPYSRAQRCPRVCCKRCCESNRFNRRWARKFTVDMTIPHREKESKPHVVQARATHILQHLSVECLSCRVFLLCPVFLKNVLR